MSAPVITIGLPTHLTGEGYTIRVCEVLADGEETGIVLTTKTDGPPDFRITAHVLHHGDDVVDLLDPEDEDPDAWIMERVGKGSPCAD